MGEGCTTCCTTRRTSVFFAERGLSKMNGAHNIGTWKNQSIAGRTKSTPFDNIYADILKILADDPNYFISASKKPLATMNYTTKFGIPCNESSWQSCYE